MTETIRDMTVPSADNAPVVTPTATPATEAVDSMVAKAPESVSTDESSDTADKAKAPEEGKEAAPKVDHLARAKAAAEREKARRSEQRQREAERQRLAWENQQAKAQLEQERAERTRISEEAKKHQALLDKWRSDPLAAYEEAGITADKVIASAKERNSPEYQLKKVQEEFAKQLAAERAERERLQAEIQKSREEQNQAKQAAAIEQARQEFIKATSNEAKFPVISRLMKVPTRQNALMREAATIYQQVSSQGYSESDVLDYLESEYAKAYAPPNSSGATESKATQNASETSIGTGAQDKTQAGKPRTLTNTDASQKGTIPKAIDEMTEAESREYLASLYRKSTRRAG